MASGHPSGLPLKGEQTFFDDPALDRVLAMVMTLAAELHVTRDRLGTLERMIERGEAVSPAALDAHVPGPDEKAALDAARQRFAEALMACTLGMEVSLGAPEEGVDRFDQS